MVTTIVKFKVPKKDRMIIIFEPQCVGFEHVDFNAAFILVLANAFKEEKLLFVAEHEHLNFVRNILKDYNIDIDYMVMGVPKRSQTDFFRFPLEFNNVKKIFNLAKESESSKIIFTSVQSSTIASIKMLIRFFSDLAVLIVLHGELSTISSFPRLPVKIIFWLKFWLKFFNSKRLKYLVLGSPIKKQLVNQIPQLSQCIYSIDHPYFNKNNQTDGFTSNTKIKFGYLGVIHVLKGINLFFKLSEEINRLENIKLAEFFVIGHVTDNSTNIFPKSVIVPSPFTPLTQEQYNQYVKEIDYVIFAHEEIYSKFRASGTLFFDAFSYLKPIIALKNPYLEYYFDKMGDIGYLCDDFEHMKEIVVELVNNSSKERYVQQQNNILKGRKEFNFEKLSERFKNIWDDF